MTALFDALPIGLRAACCVPLSLLAFLWVVAALALLPEDDDE